MAISIIVATSKNGIIGVDNKLPWHLPKDLKNFRKKTSGKAVIMGRKTYESIGKPLSNRYNVILTTDTEYKAEGCVVVHSMTEAIEEIPSYLETMVIGGGQIYEQFLPLTDFIYQTVIDIEVEGDTTFEVPQGFEVVSKEEFDDGLLENGQTISYVFIKWKRITEGALF